MTRNGISTAKRARIYDRDDYKCVYCRSSNKLSLDHIQPKCKNGSNHHTNLVTSCIRCNSSRQDKSVRSFCIEMSRSTGESWMQMLLRVKASQRRKLKPREVVIRREREKNAQGAYSSHYTPGPMAHRKQGDSPGTPRLRLSDECRRMQVLEAVAQATGLTSSPRPPADDGTVEHPDPALEVGWARVRLASGKEVGVASIRRPRFGGAASGA